MFLDHTLWHGTLADLVTSRTAFLNNNLATMIYDVPVPPGSTAVNFVSRSTLPAEQRSGMLTNAGFLTTRARATGVSLIARGLALHTLMLCRDFPPPPDTITPEDYPPRGQPNPTAQVEVASRADVGNCADLS